MTIVGVVRTVKYAGLNAPDAAEMYYPQEQTSIPVATSSLVVRSEGSPQPLIVSRTGDCCRENGFRFGDDECDADR